MIVKERDLIKICYLYGNGDDSVIIHIYIMARCLQEVSTRNKKK